MDIAQLPKSTECEKELLGSILLLPECLDEIRAIVGPGHFVDPLHSRTYALMLELSDDDIPLDKPLLLDRLKNEYPDQNVSAYLFEATTSVATAAHAEHYARSIRSAADRRQVIAAAQRAINAAREDLDVAPVIERLESNLAVIRSDSPDGPPLTTLAAAAEQHIHAMEQDKCNLIRTELPDVDHAIGGGLALGEMVVISARPSHGKTAIALQCCHAFTKAGLPCLYISEEMSSLALGKRALQFTSDIPEEHWRGSESNLRGDIAAYSGERAKCHIAVQLGTSDRAAREIERAVSQHGVKVAVVDYCQLLSSPGKSSYEQVSYTSTLLRRLASDLNIVVLALCQTGRAMDSRKHFVPIMSDIKGSGQFEQDADVIMFLVWPHKYDPKKPANEYQIFIAKNRNRPIMQNVVVCRFEPSRQRIMQTTIRDMPNYRPEFDDHENDPWK